jgi:hypothetical protein
MRMKKGCREGNMGDVSVHVTRTPTDDEPLKKGWDG